VWLKKALLFTLICVVGVLVVVPKTRIAQDLVRAHFLPWYEQLLGCTVVCNKLSFSLLFPTLELSDVSLESRDAAKPWRCDCKSVVLRASWFSIIMNRCLNLSVTINKPAITSGTQGLHVYFIENHVYRYFGGPESLPIALKELKLLHADIRVDDQSNSLKLQGVFSCDYKKIAAGYGLTFYCENGSLTYGSYLLVQACKGSWQSTFKPGVLESRTIQSETYQSLTDACIMTGHGQGELTLFQNEHAEACYWEGKAVNGATTVTLWRSESDDLCSMTLGEKNLEVMLTMALSRIAEHFAPSAYAHMVKGTLKGSYHASRAEGFEKGHMTLAVQEGAYGNHELFKEAIFSVPPPSDGIYRGDVSLKLAEKEALSGFWSWDPKVKKGSARLVNAQGIELGFFSLGPDSAGKGGYLATTVLHVLYDKPEKDSTLLVKAEARYAKGELSFHAHRGQEQFSLEGTFAETFDISLLRWTDSANKTLIDLSYDSAEKHRITGVVDVGAVERMAKCIWGMALHGEGAVQVRGHYVNKRYELVLEGSKLAIRLPRIYNVINGLVGTFTFDPQASTLDLSDVRCTLHRGTFSIPHATIQYEPVQEIVVFDIPLSLNSFWFNIEKDLYALVSGDLMFKCTGATAPFLRGEVIVERAHVSESLLKLPELQKVSSQSIFEEAHLYPLGLDITVRSKNPIRVTLARLEGAAHIAMHVGNTLADPTLSGIIRLEEGKVVFPYKPLTIRKALITFVPQLSYDPMIELFAKNRIKGYDVSLSIQGTLSSHDMRLQSTPSLSDEQLVGLLYAGSEQGALGALVPSMVMRNISSIFSKNGSEVSTSSGDKNSWRERLKRIRIVPSFTDERARGGVRGTLEVDINDRWRALMQSNFLHTEDTRFELDYDLSDDVLLRALRDEHRDIGAEIEVKMKF